MSWQKICALFDCCCKAEETPTQAVGEGLGAPAALAPDQGRRRSDTPATNAIAPWYPTMDNRRFIPGNSLIGTAPIPATAPIPGAAPTPGATMNAPTM